MGQPLIILGRSARSAAASAIRAEYEPWCFDLSGARDLPAPERSWQCPPDRYPTGLLAQLDRAPLSAKVLLCGDMENYPQAVQAIAFERDMLGCSAQTLEQVRSPDVLPSLPGTRGLRAPRTLVRASLMWRFGRLIFGAWGRHRYLRKPLASWGGHGIEWWRPGQRLGRSHYLQRFIRGIGYTAVFMGDGWSARLLGVTEQLVGEPELNAGEFEHCGWIGPISVSQQARSTLSHVGVQLVQRYDVRGLFGIDLVMDFRGQLWPVEVNPRYVEAAEVLERAGSDPLLGERVKAPTARAGGRQVAPRHRIAGKAMLLARQRVKVEDLYEQVPEAQLADVPPVGSTIQPGERVCTVFAEGARRDEVHESLLAAATPVCRALDLRRSGMGV